MVHHHVSMASNHAAVQQFAQRLLARAERVPLDGDDIRRELDAFLNRRMPDVVVELGRSLPVPRTAVQAKPKAKRRSHIFERAMVQRFEGLLRRDDGTLPPVSRRMILGLTYAMTRLIGSDSFHAHAQGAEAIAAFHAGNSNEDVVPATFADPRLRILVHRGLLDLAGKFDDFPRQATEFIGLINGRLAAAQPEGWDRHWTLTRVTALQVLQALYADLRQEMRDPVTVADRYGAAAVEALDRFLAELDQSTRLADRPWLVKPIR